MTNDATLFLIINVLIALCHVLLASQSVKDMQEKGPSLDIRFCYLLMEMAVFILSSHLWEQHRAYAIAFCLWDFLIYDLLYLGQGFPIRGARTPWECKAAS